MKSAIIKNKFTMLICVFASILEVIGELSFAYFMMYATDMATGNIEPSLSRLVIVAVASTFFKILFTYFNDASKQYMANKTMATWKNSILESYLKNDLDKNPSEVLNIITNVAVQVEQNVLMPILSIFTNIIFLIGSSLAIFFVNWKILMFYLICSWIPIVLPKTFEKKTQEKVSDSMKQAEMFVSKVREVTSGYEIIKSFSLENKMFNLVEDETNKAHRKRYEAGNYQKFHENFTGFISVLIFSLGLALSCYMVLLGEIRIGEAMAIMQLSNYIQVPLMGIPIQLVKIKSMGKEMQSLDGFVNQKPATIKGSNFKFEEDIVLDDVSFSYDGKIDILKGIDLNIEKGGKYAIIGPSGCGKSTIAKILMRRLVDYKGSIKIDGQELSSINEKSFYNNVAPVTQDVFIFNDTIANNITLYNPNLEERLDMAIDNAGLREMVENLDQGEDTLIGEYGQDLSGGQKQRISIARCLIKEAELIIMDEATSSLDQKVAREIENLLLSLEQTVIVITHRIDDEILLKYDKIFKMGYGVISDEGKWTEIKERI